MLAAGNALVVIFLVFRPKVKCVGEDDVPEKIVRFVVRHVERGIHLEVRGDVPGEANRGRVFTTALEIDLDTPLLIKVVGEPRIASFL